MTEFQIGDIVRLTEGEPDKPGYRVEVRTVTEGLSKGSEINLHTLGAYGDDRWEVELIERPVPPPPTRPNSLGWTTVGGTRHLARLGDHSLWELYDKDGAMECGVAPSTIEDFEEAVLIPKTLADKVMEWADDDHSRGWLTVSIMQQIADHLKGQDNE